MATKVKPLDLSNILRDAFLSGAGVAKNGAIPEDVYRRWVEYDLDENPCFERIVDALREHKDAVSLVERGTLPETVVSQKTIDEAAKRIYEELVPLSVRGGWNPDKLTAQQSQAVDLARAAYGVDPYIRLPGPLVWREYDDGKWHRAEQHAIERLASGRWRLHGSCGVGEGEFTRLDDAKNVAQQRTNGVKVC